MSLEEIISQIDAEIAALTNARTLLSGLSSAKRGLGRPKTAKVPPAAKPKTRVLSPEARKRIADAQKKRWAAQKKAAKKSAVKKTSAETTETKPTLPKAASKKAAKKAASAQAEATQKAKQTHAN